ncbi:hypothetical protein [Halobellus rufus]|uniref:hypothetical protein n=1 Tax=Halobellus rufus TaxID=1448860 RepID=UPI0006784376|nr:hypothetical protein [Halobellus rufus]
MNSSDSWKRLAADPDPARDLGYDLHEWEVHRVSYRDGDQVVFVPADEDAFDREAYIVASADALCETLENR